MALWLLWTNGKLRVGNGVVINAVNTTLASLDVDVQDATTLGVTADRVTTVNVVRTQRKTWFTSLHLVWPIQGQSCAHCEMENINKKQVHCARFVLS